ncbi:DinB family protein [Isoptericola sp. NEAU-Y5]|uniref:DinB family protein n=1 Tax=Isoptericola luteus TaxID=2879484 RepID=A0ABS7ZJL9_9MICO|nr:DinB family protein [Isoptericola sp. NEAU-Y5]MCA5894727.1 DinB family protein [Isoptericola sp. NEAU-Y5]
MATFESTKDLRGARFEDVTLQGARFVACDLSEVVMRGVLVADADIDSPWLPESDRFLVNGVDVIGYVEDELNRRFPGRGQRHATDRDGLLAAWDVLQRTWAATLERVETMPLGTVDVSVDGEWSFAQTLRHLVMATDTWLCRTVLDHAQPYHPIGLANNGAAEDGLDMSVFMATEPSYAEVLAVRAGRVALVRDAIAGASPQWLAEEHPEPWVPSARATTLKCLHVILDEEWEHHRYAVRDLDAIERG